MRLNIYATTVGHVPTLDIMWRSYVQNGWVHQSRDCDVKFYLMVDRWIGVDRTEFDEWAIDKPLTVLYDDDGFGINWRWYKCCRHAFYDHAEYTCLLNDDVFIVHGNIDSMVQVLHRNSHVALTGVPANGVAHDRINARERWYSDPTVFEDPHVWEEQGPAIKREPWVSGFMFMLKTEPFLMAGGFDLPTYWQGGEMNAGMNLTKAGWMAASIYKPLTFHGGSMREVVHVDEDRSRRFRERQGRDGELFAARYGTGHAHLLHAEIMKTFSQDVVLLYDPPSQPESTTHV